jgi:hypothetical protein
MGFAAQVPSQDTNALANAPQAHKEKSYGASKHKIRWVSERRQRPGAVALCVQLVFVGLGEIGLSTHGQVKNSKEYD